MPPKNFSPSKLKFLPLTPGRWKDFEELFGPRGACGGCWCMWWRLKRSEFERKKGAGNKRAMKKIVQSGEIPGLLAYHEGKAAAWCSIAPREGFPVLERSRVLKRVDDLPVWSLNCFFIAKELRGKGVSGALTRAAVDFAAGKGAEIVEAYPVEPKKERMPGVFAWTGFARTFLRAGFVEVARRSETRPIMRYYIKERNSKKRKRRTGK